MKRNNKILTLLLRISVIIPLLSCQSAVIDGTKNYEVYLGAVPVDILPHSNLSTFTDVYCSLDFKHVKLQSEKAEVIISQINGLKRQRRNLEDDFRSVIFLKSKDDEVKICIDIFNHSLVVDDKCYSTNNSFEEHLNEMLLEYFGAEYAFK